MNKFTGWIIKLEILLALGLCLYQPKIPPQPVIHHDPRIGQLARFESRHHFASDQFQYVKTIIESADKNHIDFALLPAIEYLESSGGKRFIYSTANPFGWNSDQSGFKSIADGIDFISAQLGSGRYYQDKSTYSKLRAYNPNPAYAAQAMKLIEEIHNE